MAPTTTRQSARSAALPRRVAEALAGYAELGISHLIAHVYPRTPESAARLGEAAALARDRLGAVAAG